MFTGIIESLGSVLELSKEGDNLRIEIASKFIEELKVDQSVAHNGVCLTIEKINNESYEVVAINETLLKSNLGLINVGDYLNLERCMQLNGRLDGHIVQGHVDETAILTSINHMEGSWVVEFQLKNPSFLIVEKGSICVNGVSLTAFDVKESTFKVAIIPYTYKHTNFQYLEVDDEVNIEFDIIGKYVQRWQQSV